MFDAISHQLFANVGLITAPGATDPRWPQIIAQTYREGFIKFVQDQGGSILIQADRDGGLTIVQVDATIEAADPPPVQ